MGRISLISRSPEIRPDVYLDDLEPVRQRLNIEGDITIKLGGKEESKRLNAHYLKRDYATDVLSFPIQQHLPDGYYLGDIFICLPVAREQAARNGQPLDKELLRLMIHGLLHLGGWDHETDSGEMLALQEKLLEELRR